LWFDWPTPDGLRSVVVESALVRHQLLISNRGRKRAPNLHAGDRIITGLCTLFMRPSRILRYAIVVKPSLLYFHNLLRKRKYRMLFSPRRHRPGARIMIRYTDSINGKRIFEYSR
jgi:hypothetical protein